MQHTAILPPGACLDDINERLGKARALCRAHRGLELDSDDLDWLSSMLAQEIDSAASAFGEVRHG